MLQLAGSVCLRVNVGNLLELERSLERCGVVKTTAEEEHARAVCVQRCNTLHIRLAFERFGDALGQTLELSAERTLITDGNQTAYTRDFHGNQVKRRKLRGICLGGCNGDLRACPGVQNAVRLAGNRGRYDVYDCDSECTGLLCQTHCSERVGGLTGLADDDAHILLADDRVLVTEFTCNLSGAADAAHCLDDALAYHAGMERGAAADDVNVLNVAQTLVGQAVVLEADRVVLDARLYSVGNCLGLLHDLLEHEVLIAALFCGGHIPVDRLDFLLDNVAELVHDNDLIRTNDSDLVVIEDDEAAGTADDSGDVGGNHVLTLADADNERIVAAGRNDFLRVVHGHNAERVGAAQTLYGREDGLRQILLLAGVKIINKVRDGLGIGLRFELVAMRLKAGAQLLVVFDDAVVHNGDLALAAEMRMRVAVGRLAVGRPAGVADAAGAVERCLVLADFCFEVCNAAARLYDTQTVLRKCSNTGGVIAAVFQAVKTLDQNGERVLASRETNNSTHNQFTPPKRNIFINQLNSKEKFCARIWA